MEARVVMAFILAALVFILEAAGVLIAVLLGLILLAISMPVKARVSGSVRADGLLEGVLDDDARLVFRVAGSTEPVEPVSQTAPEPEVPVEVDYAVLGKFGPAGVAVQGGQGVEVSVLWWRFHAGGLRGEGGTDKERESGKTAKPKPKVKKAKAGRAKRGRGIALGDLRKWVAPEVRGKVAETFRNLCGSLHLQADLDVECGFADRGYTGMTYAAYTALLHTGVFGGLRFHPRFDREALNAEGSIGFSVVPIQVVWIAGKFMLAREIRPLWWKQVARRRKSVARVEAAREAR